MKLKRFIAASTLFFCALRAVACGPGPTVLPDDCDLYRILPYYAELREPDYGRVEANCRAWMKVVPNVSEASVRQAVYDFSLADWQRVQQGDDRGNTFCRHLLDTHDTDAVRLLVWSKYYEQWSEQMRSPWYYGCGFDDGGLDIDTIADIAATYRGRYADRYLLLAMKCLYRSGRSEDCEALWKKRSGVMKNSHLSDQAEGYLAACLHRLGRTKEAIAIYARLGDAASLQFLEDDKVEVFEQVLRSHPNSPFFPMALQRVLFVMENYTVDSRFTSYSLDDSQLRRLLALATRAGRDPRVKNQAMWRYTAACLLDHMGRRREALSRLNGVMAKDEFLDASIRILRIHLHSKLDRIDDRYEQQLFADLQWIDSRMQHEWNTLDSATRYRLSHFDGFGGYNYIYRTIYSYDALRRIVLGGGGLADRFIRAGRTTRAIQLANMADNRFFQISNNIIIKYNRSGSAAKMYYSYTPGDEFNSYDAYGFDIIDIDTSHMENYTMDEGRFNSHDFSNRLFVRVDRLSADKLANYWKTVEEPSTYMDSWLNERGYTNTDYWHDIIGTHFLREMRFGEAHRWLAQVDPKYQQCLNTEPWMQYDPFQYGKVKMDRTDNYKVRCAKRLMELEHQSLESASPDDRADAMLTISIALGNMFNLNESFDGHCWPLVCYGYNGLDGWLSDWWEGDVLEDRYMSSYLLADDAVVPYARQAKKKAQKLRKEAFATYVTPERKAQALRRVYEYTYLMKHLADTPTGQDIARHCDRWKDYRIQ